MKKILLLTIAIYLSVFSSQGQKLPTIDIVVGYGLLEAFHIGCQVHTFEKSQFGLYYGNALFLIPDDYSYHSFTIDHQYHFGKISELHHRQKWFFRQGLTYAIDNAEYFKTNFLFFILSAGREFHISPKIGLNFDLGLSRVLIENKKDKDPGNSPLNPTELSDFFALPEIRLQFKYSL